VPSPLVIDASTLVELLIQSARATAIDSAVGDRRLIAPDILNVEALQGLRGLQHGGALTEARAAQAVRRLVESRVARVPTQALLHEAWSLRHNLSAYDACYVALARTLACPLLTIDGPLARAPGLGVDLVTV
jgi:predicted nucleic acid-binding protein